MKPIHLRNVPPPIETFTHPVFMEFMAMWIKPECYLELGIRHGDVFFPVSKHSQYAIGVDTNISNLRWPPTNNMYLYKQTTDQFFEELNDTFQFDMVFIDADHSHEQSLKDFLNVEKHVIEDGFIFMHDTYPYDKSFINPDLSNDCYKTAHYIKTHLIDQFEILTLPFNPGVTIIKKINRNKQLIYDIV